MAHEVFISYSSKDKPTADALCARLEAHGIRCWIAPRDVLPSQAYGEEILNAIHSSRLMVLIFSGESNRSQQVMREVERAVSKGVPILPFRIENVPLSPSMEYFISAPHWLDAMTGPLAEHLERLAATAKVILAKGESDAQKEVKAQPVLPPMPPSNPVNLQARKNRLPLVLSGGVALLILVLGGAWGISRMRDQGASERQSADRTALTQPAPGKSPTAAAPNAATGAPAISDANVSRPVGNPRGKVGDELSDGKWRFLLLDVNQVKSYTMKRTTETDYAAYRNIAEFKNNTFEPKPGNTLFVFNGYVINAMKDKASLSHYGSNSHTAVLTDQGESYPPIAFDIRGTVYQSEPLLPESKLEFAAIFAVPQGTKLKELLFTLSTDVHVSLQR